MATTKTVMTPNYTTTRDSPEDPEGEPVSARGRLRLMAGESWRVTFDWDGPFGDCVEAMWVDGAGHEWSLRQGRTKPREATDKQLRYRASFIDWDREPDPSDP